MRVQSILDDVTLPKMEILYQFWLNSTALCVTNGEVSALDLPILVFWFLSIRYDNIKYDKKK